MKPVALQLFSVRGEMEVDFEGTIKRVREMGYQGVEFAGLFGRGIDDVKKLLEELELLPVSAHVPYAEMLADPEKVFGDYAALGCEYIAVPYLDEPYRPGTGNFPEVIENIKKLGKAAKDKGLTLLYHNHDFEFVKINGEYALDVLYGSVPPDLLQTEIDTCWARVAGADPADYVLKYAGRAPVIHLKDYVIQQPDGLIIGREEGEHTLAGKAFQYRPVGYGVQNIPSILDAAEKAGSKWIIVEQDDPGMEKTPLECVRMCIEYLKSLG